MGIASGPHYELAPSELARWIEARGPRTWWMVDGDHYLTSRLAFPGPTAKVAALLRKVSRPLLIADKQKRPDARGQAITWEALDEQVERLGENMFPIRPDDPLPRPEWADNRFFWLCWKDQPAEAAEWMFEEDRESAELFEAEDAPAASEG